MAIVSTFTWVGCAKLGSVAQSLQSPAKVTTVNALAGPHPPRSYYRFEAGAVLMDTQGNAKINVKAGNNYIVRSACAVGGCIEFESPKNSLPGSTSGVAVEAGNLPMNTVTPVKGVTLEFLFKPSRNAGQLRSNSLIGNDNISLSIDVDYIRFNTKAISSAGIVLNDTMNIFLDGIGRKSYAYYADGNFHHIVMTYNAVSGEKKLWIDGQLPSGFSKKVALGSNFLSTGSRLIKFPFASTYYDAAVAYYDELAIYEEAIPGSLIYQHFQNFKSGNAYNFVDQGAPVPAPESVVAANDSNEYVPGTILPTTGTRTEGALQTPVEQLTSFTLPRFRKASTPDLQMTRLVNQLSSHYNLGMRFQPGISDYQARDEMSAGLKELSRNWNYALVADGFSLTSMYDQAMISIANSAEFAAVPLTVGVRWAQVGPSPNIQVKNLADSFYLQNAAGGFINLSGGIISTAAEKTLSPDSPPSVAYPDGQYVRSRLNLLRNQTSSSLLTRGIWNIVEDGEILPKWTEAGMKLDASIVADEKNFSGLTTTANSSRWFDYAGAMTVKIEGAYSQQFMGGPYSQLGELPALQDDGTIFTIYQLAGNDNYRAKYKYERMITGKIRDHYYATQNYYPRWQWNYRNHFSSWTGLQYFLEGRINEIAEGDPLCSPYLAADFGLKEEDSIRPGAWLGQLKLLSMLGAEFFYPGIYSEMGISPANPQFDPRQKTWQMVMPAYAQGTFSYLFEEFMINGTLLPGDTPLSKTDLTGTKNLLYWSGRPDVLVAVRKSNVADRFAITTTVQGLSNMPGNAPLNAIAEIKLPIGGGATETLRFNSSRQGSTYIYDRTIPSAPVFYSLDDWHDYRHPSYWSADFQIQAEQFINSKVTSNNIKIKTDLQSGVELGDYSNPSTFVTSVALKNNVIYPNSTSGFEYAVQSRQSAKYYLKIRARNIAGGSQNLNMKMNALATESIPISGSNWTWYTLNSNGQRLNYNFGGNVKNSFKLFPQSTSIEIDRIELSMTP